MNLNPIRVVLGQMTGDMDADGIAAGGQRVLDQISKHLDEPEAIGFTRDATSQMVVDAQDQTLTLYHQGSKVRRYEISTSKYGLGDRKGSYRTPTGKMVGAKKIGSRAPS